jgi:transposase-like protein
MNEGHRTEAIAALEKASALGAEGGGSAKRSGKRSRQKDALGTTGVERVAAQGCPHCAGGEVVGWGRSHGLLRFRCKSCGRTFNALTKTPMAHLRKLDQRRSRKRTISTANAIRAIKSTPLDGYRLFIISVPPSYVSNTDVFQRKNHTA